MNSSTHLPTLSRSLSLAGEDSIASAVAVSSFLSAKMGEESLALDGMSSALRRVVVGRWFRSAQICAHDRHSFAVAGWGRLSVGLYSLYYEKWLEHFEPSQFKVRSHVNTLIMFCIY